MIDDWAPEAPDLGPCCVCLRTGSEVRNLLMLERKAPMPGRGWGCFTCGLPFDGAVAVVCDGCLHAPLRFACRGYPAEDGRVPIESLTGSHQHDRTKDQQEGES